VAGIDNITTHRLIRPHESQEQLEVVVRREDQAILRELGKKLAEIGSLPIQQERKRLWSRLNRREAVRPMIWLNDLCWHELDVDGELLMETSSPFCRRIEAGLRQTIYWWNHMPADMVVEPVVYSPLAVENTGIGVDIDEDLLETDEKNSVVSHRYHTVIKTEEDIGRIRTPVIRHNGRKSEEDYQAYKGIFDGILLVGKRGTPSISFSPWDDIVKLTGAQETLLDLALRPEFSHALVDRITSAYLGALDQYESFDLLALNNTNVRIGSGAYGYTDELPRADFNPRHVRSADLWGSATAQIFAEVSPQMHEAFALNYERRWLERFGLAYYGCCEPLDRKMEILRTVPNLRKISVSPWNDIPRIAEEIGSDYVFSFKPNPAILARESWNPDEAREELVNSLQHALKNRCSVEVIMKDISTVRYQPRRLWDWVKMATGVAEMMTT
jgi:hypothetical protein